MDKTVEKLLREVNKPSRYTGGEVGSVNKDWNSSKVRFAITFPDTYEVGISNLGCRILYHVLNKQNGVLCDRAYAPEKDFYQKLKDNDIPLYAVESKRPLKDFDVLAFSLQYELSYPTLLAILDLAKVNLLSKDRADDEPIVIAGGPGAYNPEPMSEFIDVFLIGDGETLLAEFSEKLIELKGQKRQTILKELTKLEGVYVPAFYENQKNDFSTPKPVDKTLPQKIKKRIDLFTNENTPTDFPVSFTAGVHDRAVAEIRRGCGRMCRFCQACFTNLPVRERDSKEAAQIVDELLHNTGYEEYSLLSLSSNDYTNIENLAAYLCEKYSNSGASISLPSQRADSFSLKLAQTVSSVRKSTLTFAPEAGSQRLRDVINKNLTQEQILNAVMTAYEAGWSKVKLYFMIGLPTETFDDLDEIINLLWTIKKEVYRVKSEKNIPHHLDMTCTISTFVPKTFTPFQWCAQNSMELIDEKIKYLRQKSKFIKGLKMNFSDTFLSQIEAVFSRGDRKLNKLILQTFKNGSYLDAWSENFNKELWIKSSKETNINFDDYAQRQIPLDSELPWGVIDTGVDVEWLKNEYNQAMNNQTSYPCDEKCTNCGVCQNSKNKRLTCQKTSFEKPESKVFNTQNDSVYKYRIKIEKKGNLKYISHLDWAGTFYKALRKTGLDLVFSQGFNPSPKISMGVALPLFVESEGELVDIELFDNIQPEKLKELIQPKLPDGANIVNIEQINKKSQAIENEVSWARYIAQPLDKINIKELNLSYKLSEFLEKTNLFLEKTTKKGLKKQINIRQSLHSATISDEHSGKIEFTLKTAQGAPREIQSLRADDFLQMLTPNLRWNIVRVDLLDENFKKIF